MSRQNLFLISLLVLFALVSLLGAAGPELGFDALWYHLVIPKIYLIHGGIYHIPGGLLYYSEMPRLGEILYMFIPAHAISFGVGIMSTILVYLLARKYLDREFALLSTVIFYVSPLVGWQSGSSYVDLLRTFFEILALYLFVDKKFWPSGLAIGLAISTKSLALGSLAVIGLIGIYISGWKRTMLIVIVAGLVSLPWFLSAYLTTGYPFYPIGAGILDSTNSLNIQPLNILADFWKINLNSSDPFGPVFLITFPLFLANFGKVWAKAKVVVLYSALAYLVWFVTPRTGGGRFILAYLPAWSVLAALIIFSVRQKYVRFFLITLVVVLGLVNVGYRFAAEIKVFPFLFGRETKEAYLCRNLDFHTGVFVDCDGWMRKNLKKTDLVYVQGVHNLFYLDFPFIDESWYRDEQYNYLLTNQTPGDSWQEIHNNRVTGYRVYKRV